MNYKFHSSSMSNSNNINQNPSFNNTSFFSQQAIRAGFMSSEVRRREYEFPLNPVDVRGSIQRELEKERIRADLIAEEMMRRRILEEEVRREMMMEREFGVRHGGREFSIGGGLSSGTMWLPPRRVPLLTNFEYRDKAVGKVGEAGFRERVETLPFQRDPAVARSSVALHEIKEFNGALAPPEVSINNKEQKVIILAKPSVNLADIKRKGMSQVGGALQVCKKQKTVEDWSCALCQITATSQRGLNDHLKGKKHQARERRMVSQRTGFGTGPLPKINKTTNTGKPVTLPSMASTRSIKDGKSDGKSSLSKVDYAPAQNPFEIKYTKHSQLNEASLDKKENGVAKAPASGKRKKKTRYFCKICRVRACSVEVFDTHLKGKKHLATLSAHSKNDKTVPVEASSQKVGTEGNEEAELAVEETEEGFSGKQVVTNRDDVKGNLDGVDDNETVLEKADGENLPPTTIDKKLVSTEAIAEELTGGIM